MTEVVFAPEALERIRGIHELSARYNGGMGAKHSERLMELIRGHVEEIDELMKAGDPHFLTEVGDLMILCYEMILEHQGCLDEMNTRCFERYEKKLGQLIRERGTGPL